MVVCPLCSHVMLGNPDTCKSCRQPVVFVEPDEDTSVSKHNTRPLEPDTIQAVNEALASSEHNGHDRQPETEQAANKILTGKVHTIKAHISGKVLPIDLHAGEIMLIGHGDVTDAAIGNVDLTAFDAEEYGVDSYHAAFLLENGRLEITDAGSSNGTFVNGQKVSSNEWIPLNAGDELRLGGLVMTLHFD